MDGKYNPRYLLDELKLPQLRKEITKFTSVEIKTEKIYIILAI